MDMETDMPPADTNIDLSPTSMKTAKVCTKAGVYARLLYNMESKSVKEAAARNDVKKRWIHHFSSRPIKGKALGLGEEEDCES